jgi:hypothetical protein
MPSSVSFATLSAKVSGRGLVLQAAKSSNTTALSKYLFCMGNSFDTYNSLKEIKKQD